MVTDECRSLNIVEDNFVINADLIVHVFQCLNGN